MAVKTKAGSAKSTAKKRASKPKAIPVAKPVKFPDSVRKVAYFVTEIPNRAGEGARILGPLAAGGVNLLAFTGFPSGKGAQVDFIPQNPDKFRDLAKKLKIRIKAQKFGFLVQGKDRKGAVATLLQVLADAKINVTAVDALSAGQGRYGAIFWVRPADVEKTAKLLKAK